MKAWFNGPKYNRVYYISPYGDVRSCRPDMTLRSLEKKIGATKKFTVVYGVYGRELKEPVELTAAEIFFTRMDALASLETSGRMRQKYS